MPEPAPYLVGYHEWNTPVWYWWRAFPEAGWTSWKLVNNEWEHQGALSGAGRDAILFHFGLEQYADWFPFKRVVELPPCTFFRCRRIIEDRLGLQSLRPRSRPGLSDGIEAKFVL